MSNFHGLRHPLRAPRLPKKGLMFFLNAWETSTMDLTGTRLDEWRDYFGSGRKIETGFAGTGFNPVYTSSLFNSKGGVDFKTNDFLETASAFTEVSWEGGFTIMVVGNYYAQDVFFGGSDGNGAPIFGMGVGRRLGMGTLDICAEGFPMGTDAVWGAAFGNAQYRHILNDKQFLPVEGSNTGSTGAFNKLQIGGIFAGNDPLDFRVAGILMYNRYLPPHETARAYRWLARFFELSSLTLPTFNIVCDGNSIAIGQVSDDQTTMTNGILEAAESPTESDFVNVASSGLTTAQLSTRAASTVDTHLNTSVIAARRICIVWEITNDLAGGSNAATAYANIKSYCQARVAAGWKVIVCTCLPRSNAGLRAGFETDRQTVNGDINTNAVSEGWASAVADIGDDADIGQNGDSNDTTYYNADKIHLNSAGHAIAKTYITAALDAIIP